MEQEYDFKRRHIHGDAPSLQMLKSTTREWPTVGMHLHLDDHRWHFLGLLERYQEPVCVSCKDLPNTVIEHYWPTHSFLSPHVLSAPPAARGQRLFSYQPPLPHAAPVINGMTTEAAHGFSGVRCSNATFPTMLVTVFSEDTSFC